MKINDLVHEMVHTMAAAEAASNQKEARSLINRATKLRAAIDYAKTHPDYQYGPAHEGQKVGGSFGSDDYVERWHF